MVPAPFSLEKLAMKKLIIAAAVAASAITSVVPAFAYGGYHYVRPYTTYNGVYHEGHMQGNPDGYCFNNLGGC